MNVRAIARTVAAAALGVGLTLQLVGCSPRPTAPPTLPGGKAQTNAFNAPTLTKDTLPIKVGTKWTVIRNDDDGMPVSLPIQGPWEFTAGEGWHTEDYELVDPSTVPGIGDFKDYTFVLRVTSPVVDTYYYPRQVTDDWVMAMGQIKESAEGAKTEPYEPVKFWPLGFQVGQTYTVQEHEAFIQTAEVLARNTATVPAGTIEDSYLVHFRVAYKDGRVPFDNYYLFAPNVGIVAYFGNPTGGDEKTGFTKADSIILLSAMPE